MNSKRKYIVNSSFIWVKQQKETVLQVLNSYILQNMVGVYYKIIIYRYWTHSILLERLLSSPIQELVKVIIFFTGLLDTHILTWLGWYCMYSFLFLFQIQNSVKCIYFVSNSIDINVWNGIIEYEFLFQIYFSVLKWQPNNFTSHMSRFISFFFGKKPS